MTRTNKITAAASRPALLALALLLAGCGNSAGGPGLPLRIEISHSVGQAPLRLGQTYQSGSGEAWSAERLRYYLSNFRLRREDGGWFVNPQSPHDSRGYFLVDEADPSSRHFSIGPVPAAGYSGLEFLLGVDAARNGGGAQSGTLDPARGMFWTWNTGYIFFLFEGRSPQSTDSEHALVWHVGGGGVEAHRVFLPFTAPVEVSAEQGAELHLEADLARLFDGAHRLRAAQLPTAMEPAAAAEVADNAAALFRLDHIHRLPRAALISGS